MSNSKLFVALSVVALATASAACGGQVEDEGAPADEAHVASATEGLVIDQLSRESVSGSFARDGVGLVFELSTIPGGHVADIRDASGGPLIKSTLRDGVEESDIAGGRLHVRGSVDTDKPEVTGDLRAFDALNANPATKLIAELKEALVAKRIDPVLYSAGAAPTGGIHAQQYQDPYSGFWHLAYGETHSFPTWTFWAWTTFELRTEDGASITSASLQAGAASPETTGAIYPGQVKYISRQYWGVWVNVRNTAYPGCINGSCANTHLIVKAH